MSDTESALNRMDNCHSRLTDHKEFEGHDVCRKSAVHRLFNSRWLDQRRNDRSTVHFANGETVFTGEIFRLARQNVQVAEVCDVQTKHCC